MLTRIAVVPYPPLLVPELTVRAGPETEQLRGACLRAVSSLTDSARTWVALGVDRYGPRRITPDAVGTFSGYGVDVTVSLGGGEGISRPDPLLPLPALVAGWLRARAGAEAVTVDLLATEETRQESRDHGARRALSETSVGLLVLTDGARAGGGSARSARDDAAQVDERIRRALEAADTGSLLDLPPDRCARAGLRGRAALQALAGAAETEGKVWTGRLLYSEAPYGVGYHVAVWSRTDD